MGVRYVLGLIVIAILGAPAFCFGQWVRYPTSDAPRKADGTPDLTAPAPRLPGGKPDFSGLWHTAAINLGQDLPGGLPYQPSAAELVKRKFSKDDPHVRSPTILRGHGHAAPD
jgi:hypothetical protein